MRLCPKGDDPLTSNTDFRTIQFTTSAAAGSLDGSFKFVFEGEYFYFPADASAFDSADCKESFEGLQNVKEVICTRSAVDANNGATYTVIFKAFPLFPYQNNIYKHDGDPLLSSFQCENEKVTAGTSPLCMLSDMTSSDFPGFESINLFLF